MGKPTLDETRDAKLAIVEQLKGHEHFAGAGIGLHNGHLVVKVNWRELPSEVNQLRRVGNVEVTHHKVGTFRAQSTY